MIFEITDDVFVACGSSKHEHSIACDALSVLLRAHREGKHAVIVPATAARQKLPPGTLSDHDNATLKRIISARAQLASLKSEVRTYAVVTTATDRVKRRTIAHQTVFELGVKWIAGHSERGSATTLLAENATDARLFLRLARARAHHRSLKVPLAATPRGGGGSEVVTELESLDSQGLPTLCIVDSDKNHPACAHGRNARAVQQYQAKGLTHAEVLWCRELENALPLSAIVHAADSRRGVSPELREAVAELERLSMNGTAAWYPYADLKEGIKGRDIARGHLRHVAELQWVTQTDSCEDAAQSECQKGGCACIFSRGLGSSIANQTLESLEQESVPKCAEICSFACNPSLAELSDLIISYAFAWRREVT